MVTIVPSLDAHTLVSLSKFILLSATPPVSISHTEKPSEALLAFIKRRHLSSSMLMLSQWTSLGFPGFIDPQK